MNTFKLNIYTPLGLYLSTDVEFLNVRSEKYNLGILPHHAPLISTLVTSNMFITINGNKLGYAISDGIIKVDQNGDVDLVLNSIESENEIDLDRALRAKSRAESRLKETNDPNLIASSKKALARALNRIRLINKE